jgi:hypothetical protein
MNKELVTVVLIIVLIEVDFIAYDILRRRFTTRIKHLNPEAFHHIFCPSTNSSAFSESLDDQIALTVQAHYIRSAAYRELNDKGTILIGDRLRWLFRVQMFLGFCFLVTIAFLFSE